MWIIYFSEYIWAGQEEKCMFKTENGCIQSERLIFLSLNF